MKGSRICLSEILSILLAASGALVGVDVVLFVVEAGNWTDVRPADDGHVAAPVSRALRRPVAHA